MKRTRTLRASRRDGAGAAAGARPLGALCAMAPWGRAAGHGAARPGAPLPPGPRGGGAPHPARPLRHVPRLRGGAAGPPRGAAPAAPAPARPRPRRRGSHPRRARLGWAGLGWALGRRRLRRSPPREVPGQRRLRCYLRGRLTSAPPGAPAIARRPQPPSGRAGPPVPAAPS